MLTELIVLGRQINMNQTNTFIQIELPSLLVPLKRKHINKESDVAGKVRNGEMIREKGMETAGKERKYQA